MGRLGCVARQVFRCCLWRRGNRDSATADWLAGFEGRGGRAGFRTPGGAGPALPGTRTGGQGVRDMLKCVAVCLPVGQELLTSAPASETPENESTVMRV